MLHRFDGARGQERLLDLLARQTLIAGDAALAQELASVAHLSEADPDEILIEQGTTDAAVHFIVVGSVSITVNGRIIGTREAGTQVGEGAAIDAAATRNASVIANEPTVVARVEADDFLAFAERHQVVWRRLAVETGRRLRQRNVFHRPPNAVPRLFIGCSSERIPFGEALRSNVESEELGVTLWTDGVFRPGDAAIESLVAELDTADFAVLVLSAEDAAVIRGEEVSVTRDNVIFELGLFMGAIGRHRAVMLRPRGIELHIPTDLLGVTALSYAPDEDLDQVVADVAREVKALTKRMGSR